MIAALNDFQEEGGAILHVFGENLQKVAMVIIVNQDPQALKLWKYLNKDLLKSQLKFFMCKGL